MSRNASLDRAASPEPALESEVSLIDNTRTPDEAQTPDGDDSTTPLAKASTFTRINSHKLREGLARRKYARYSKDRYEDDDIDDEDGTATDTPPTRTGTFTPAQRSRAGTGTTAGRDGKAAEGRLRRGEDRVRGMLGRRKVRQTKEGDTAIDVLWENQRGSFFFGRPYYSSQSLLNFDASGWTNHYGQPSAVDITSAQCPDPTWEWARKTWYVDMSLDVDEQGWQYSFMFQTRFAWHGTHPWLHSFVRRRRWIRKRVRKHRHLPDGRVEGGHDMKEAHRLNADYFTIHPTRRGDDATSYTASTAANLQQQTLPEDQDDEAEITNIPRLIQHLKAATVDREKINLVLRFMDEGGQDLHYLADEMPHIMSLLIYQYSRRQLLAGMLRKVDDEVDRKPTSGAKARKEQDKGKGKGKGPSSPTSPTSPRSPSITISPPPLHTPDPISAATAAVQRRKDLDAAVRAADAQIQHLEYWSDIRGTVASGQSVRAVDAEGGWDPEEWKGIDGSGPGPRPSGKGVEGVGGAVPAPVAAGINGERGRGKGEEGGKDGEVPQTDAAKGPEAEEEGIEEEEVERERERDGADASKDGEPEEGKGKGRGG